MKIKMPTVYGDEICEALKEVFNCDTDEELLGAFEAAMKVALESEVEDTSGLDLKCELID